MTGVTPNGFEFRPMGQSDQSREIHKYDDVDLDGASHHHTLGVGPTQAARGSHTHEGVYAPLVHNHDGVYSPVDHNHDSLYLSVDVPYAKATAGALNYPTSGGWLKHSVWTSVEELDGITYSAANDEWTVTKDGIYLLNESITFPVGASPSARAVGYSINGGVRVGRVASSNPNNSSGCEFTDTVRLVAGDKVHIEAFQSSGGALVSNGGYFNIIWMRP